MLLARSWLPVVYATPGALVLDGSHQRESDRGKVGGRDQSIPHWEMHALLSPWIRPEPSCGPIPKQYTEEDGFMSLSRRGEGWARRVCTLPPGGITDCVWTFCHKNGQPRMLMPCTKELSAPNARCDQEDLTKGSAEPGK